LDVGCSIGLFLSLAKEKGFIVSGTDISSLSGKFAKEKYNIDVKVGNFIELDFPNSYYDMITLWQVIEHLADPNTFLQKIFTMLKPGGFFCVATPDTNTIFRRLYKKFWGIYVPDLHIALFNENNIRIILKRNGFKPLVSKSVHETNAISEQWDYIKFFAVRISKNIVLKTKIFKPLVPKKLLNSWEAQEYLDIPLPCVNYSVFAIAQKPITMI